MIATNLEPNDESVWRYLKFKKTISRAILFNNGRLIERGLWSVSWAVLRVWTEAVRVPPTLEFFFYYPVREKDMIVYLSHGLGRIVGLKPPWTPETISRPLPYPLSLYTENFETENFGASTPRYINFWTLGPPTPSSFFFTLY